MTVLYCTTCDIEYEAGTAYCPDCMDELRVRWAGGPAEATGAAGAGDPPLSPWSDSPGGRASADSTAGAAAGGEGAGAANSEPVEWYPDVCWRCGIASPHPENTECLNPDCRRPLRPPALLLEFPGGEVELSPGETAELGRWGEHAAVFRYHSNVSRRHALIGAGWGGGAWVEPLATPNGTFLDGVELPPRERRPLRNGQRLRFALHAEAVATVFAHYAD